ncbi:MAG TPA: hypothetical protein VGL81_10160 [Polyangiaceae bacterium]
MNFLLHHHLAFRDLGRHDAAAGAMLPDVWRMAGRRTRARAAPEHAVGAVRPVDEGIAHHLEVDAWFHAAPVFTRGERAAREALRRARGVAKLGLFAHIAWELCLDGALLRRIGFEAVVEAVRVSVEAVRPDAHHRAAVLHAGPRATETLAMRQRFEDRVDQILDAIARGPWIAGYATGHGIAERLEGVRMRLGFPEMADADRDAIAVGLDALRDEADGALAEILSAG